MYASTLRYRGCGEEVQRGWNVYILLILIRFLRFLCTYDAMICLSPEFVDTVGKSEAQVKGLER